MNNNLPVIILKGLTLFPYQEVRIELNNKISRKTIEISTKKFEDEILVVCPFDQIEENPEVVDLPKVGAIGKIKAKIELPNGNFRVVINGIKRVLIDSYYNKSDDLEVLFANIKQVELPKFNEIEEQSRTRKLLEFFKKYMKKTPRISNSILESIKNTNDISKLTDLITSFLPFSIEKKLFYTQELNPLKRAESLIKDLNIELEIINLDKKLANSLKSSLESSQKEFVLKEKIKEIKKELGEEDYKEKEILEYKNKLDLLNLNNNISNKILAEINKYEFVTNLSPEASIIKNYIETILNLPWNKISEDESNLNKISKKLDETHYGLEKAKKRIIEYIAIKKRNPDLISPIICLVGPPGTGKTTFAMSVAFSLKKEFYKISVGGLNDSNELTGHRRTYIGANPGKIINAISKCGTKNPLILIDEIDKMVKDFKGDPASTLLDILDVNQNKKFVDNYIEEPFDLSQILFVVTANDEENIPPELRDRLEIIKLNSYTDYEKINIARDYLLPNIYKDHLVSPKNIIIKENIIKLVIDKYTKESGVRELNRKLSTIVRKIVTSYEKTKKETKQIINKNVLLELLGDFEYNNKTVKNKITGVINGLAYTPFGGIIMPIEVSMFPGKGEIFYTGNMGNVIKESTKVAITYIKSNCQKYGIDIKLFEENNFHIHLLEASIKKEGPSAGIAITTALLSLILNKVISYEIAFTGEISLKGNILKVGGVKEKVLAAYNEGIKIIYLPKENENEIKNIPHEISTQMKFVFVQKYIEVYKSLFN